MKPERAALPAGPGRSTRRASPSRAPSSRPGPATTRPRSTPGAAAATTRWTSPAPSRERIALARMRARARPRSSGAARCSDPDPRAASRRWPQQRQIPRCYAEELLARPPDGRGVRALRDHGRAAALLLPGGGHGGAHDVPRDGGGRPARPAPRRPPRHGHAAHEHLPRRDGGLGAAATSTCPTSCWAAPVADELWARRGEPLPRDLDARRPRARCRPAPPQAAALYRSGDAGHALALLALRAGGAHRAARVRGHRRRGGVARPRRVGGPRHRPPFAQAALRGPGLR